MSKTEYAISYWALIILGQLAEMRNEITWANVYLLLAFLSFFLYIKTDK